VFGMPKEAIRMGGVDHVLPLGQIGQALIQMLRH
jgi:two-component system, chemotaxis family, protein-glutamate methylesterase/glutaminase